MNIVRIINQNKLQIIAVIIAIIIIIGIIQTLNHFAKIENETSKNTENITQIDTKDKTLSSAISNNNTKTDNAENYKKVIEDFLKLCNNKEPERAYAMLSEECKETMYSSYQLFYNNYYMKKFLIILLVIIILATGGKTTGNIQDFISVVSSNNQYKLNINSYIGRRPINTETDIGEIKFKVIKKDINMKYEKYYIEVENTGNTDIVLDNLNKTGTMYLQDSNEVKYSYINEEITKELLRVKSKSKAQITIKFSNSYISDRELEKIVFSKAQIENTDNTTKEIQFEIKL